jgi:hypothetical protein
MTCGGKVAYGSYDARIAVRLRKQKQRVRFAVSRTKMLLAAWGQRWDVGERADAGPLPRCTLRDQHFPSGPKGPGKIDRRHRWQ